MISIHKFILVAGFSWGLVSCGSSDPSSLFSSGSTDEVTIELGGETLISSVDFASIQQEGSELSVFDKVTEDSALPMLSTSLDYLKSEADSWLMGVKDAGNCEGLVEETIEIPSGTKISSDRSLKKFHKSLMYTRVSWCLQTDQFEEAISIVNDLDFQNSLSETITDVYQAGEGVHCMKTRTEMGGFLKPTHFCMKGFDGYSSDQSTYGLFEVLSEGENGGEGNQDVYLNRRLLVITSVGDQIAIQQQTMTRAQNVPAFGRSKAKEKLHTMAVNAEKELKLRLGL